MNSNNVDLSAAKKPTFLGSVVALCRGCGNCDQHQHCQYCSSHGSRLSLIKTVNGAAPFSHVSPSAQVANCALLTRLRLCLVDEGGAFLYLRIADEGVRRAAHA